MSVAADVARGASTVVVVAVGSTTYAIDGQEVPELGKDTAFDALEAAGVYRLLDRAWVRASGGAADAAAPRTPTALRWATRWSSLAFRRFVWERVRPSRGALLQSEWALYQYLARAYYWLQGWL